MLSAPSPQSREPRDTKTENIPSCVGVEIEVASRDRHISFMFVEEPPRLRAGFMTSPGVVTITGIRRLKDLPRHLTAPLALAPLACPAGTALKARANHAGLEEWCEGTQGKHGPARSWFSTGIYLMAKGAYRQGRKVGRWIECDRFERCREKTYD